MSQSINDDLRPAQAGPTAIDHEQGHHHGAERLAFALRGRRLVVLEHDYLDDVDRDVVERQRFAIDGVCEQPCPPLDGFEAEDLRLEVEGVTAVGKELAAKKRLEELMERKRAKRDLEDFDDYDV